MVVLIEGFFSYNLIKHSRILKYTLMGLVLYGYVIILGILIFTDVSQKLKNFSYEKCLLEEGPSLAL